MNSERYDRLIADLRSEYRPQREWGEGRGILLVIGHFLVGVAGGTWLMASLYGGGVTGLIVAYLLGALGGVVHLMFLGRPERAFKMIRHFRTSWISRGFIGLSLFLVGGTLYLATLLIPSTGFPAMVGEGGQLLAGVGTFMIIGYMGFCYTASKGIPFWGSPLHPVLYIAIAIRGGVAALLVIAAVRAPGIDDVLLRAWLVATAAVALLYGLEVHHAVAGGNAAARRSVKEILAGRIATLFYLGSLAVGLAVPVVLLVQPVTHTAATMALIGLASAAGDFFLKLSTVKAGVYLPLRPSPSARA